MPRPFPFSTVALVTMLLPAVAHADPGSGAGGLNAGLAHPFMGPDHILAMTAVGLWAALIGGRAVWMVPATFVGCMVAGFFLALRGVSFPAVEPGVAGSVVALGLLIAAAARPPLVLSMPLVGLFAVLHGHAHGAELTGATTAFLPGFLVATVLLHGAGVSLGRVFRQGGRPALARTLGALTAGLGLALLGSLS